MKVDNKANGGLIQSTQSSIASKAQESKKNNPLSQLGQNPSSQVSKQDAARIDLSSQAQNLKKAKEAAAQSPDVDLEKVKKFQALIDSGNYKVDSKKVADKLVDDHIMNAALTDERS